MDGLQPDDQPAEFAAQARERPPPFWLEFWQFLRQSKKWWLVPIVVALLVLGLLIAVGSSPVAAPFIYTLW